MTSEKRARPFNMTTSQASAHVHIPTAMRNVPQMTAFGDGYVDAIALASATRGGAGD